MSSSPYRCDQALDDLLRLSGACAWGVAPAGRISDAEAQAYHAWLLQGNAAGMDYLARNESLRIDTGNLLAGARSIIVTAFAYGNPEGLVPKLNIASYALGADYHHVLKAHLQPVVELLQQRGSDARVCVDSAPMAERYWAVRAGIGRIGSNCMLYVPGVGCRVVLASVVTTAVLPCSEAPQSFFRAGCSNCRRCIDACPTGALRGDGTLDARRCINYLTIEHRGDLPEGTDLHGSVFGCDRCTDACPAPRGVTPVDELLPDSRTLQLDAAALESMSSSAFNRRFRFSPLARAGLKSLLRNLHATCK